MEDQPGTPKKMGPWAALGALAVLAVILLGFLWGFVAIITSAV